MKNFRHILLYGIVLTSFLNGCNTLDPIPTNQHTDSTFWQSAANAEMLINMAYNQMYSADKMWNDEALSDNIFEGRSNTDQRAIRNGVADPTLGRFAGEWSDAYGGIKSCHILLENLDRVPDMPEALKNRRKAEIRFIRAFIYFRLVNFYGDVPFFTSDITLEESKVIARTPKATILDFIHDELEEISPQLPNRNQLAGNGSENGRITRGAVMALQARAYLYESNWEKVVDYCDSLINQQSTYGQYALFPSYSGLFAAANEYNEEVILDCAYVPIVRTWAKYYDAAPLSVGARLNAYAPMQSLVDNYVMLDGQRPDQNPSYNDNNPYVNRDPRLTATVVYHGNELTDLNGETHTIYIRPGTGSNSRERLDLYVDATSNSTPTGYYMKKYFDVTATSVFASGLNIIMFRYADILLMYAEAKHALGQFDESTWNQTIRQIRERAGFTEESALSFPASLSTNEMTRLIRDERRSELALEGLRYYDIVRWRAGTQYLNGTVLGAKFVNINTEYIRLDERRFDENRDYLWSVPRSQMDINPNLLPNNPGYAN